MKRIASLCLLSLTSCASLTSGWAKVSLPYGGELEEFMVCRMTVKKDDLHAECVGVGELAKKKQKDATPEVSRF
jgi:hypothetical protein